MDFKIAVGYVRTSGDINPKTSIPNQKNTIKEYCHNHQIILRKIYVDECKTGTKVDGRDQYLEMKHVLEKENINTVVVSNYDRFGRESLEFTKTLISLKKSGVGVISVSQSSNSMEMSTIQIAMSGIQAEMENKFRIDRLKTGREQARKLGKFSVRHLPFGYQLDHDRHLVINPAEAPIVKEIFDAFLQIESYTKTFKKMKEKYSSTPLSRDRVRGILSNSLYIGKDCKTIEKEDGTIDFELISSQQHESIISEDLYCRAYYLLKKTAAKYQRAVVRPYVEYVLANVIACENCRKQLRGNKGFYRCDCQKQLMMEEIHQQWLGCLQTMENQNKTQSSYEGKKIKIVEEMAKVNLRFASCIISDATYNRLRKGLYEQLTLLEQEEVDVGGYAIQNLSRLFNEGKKVELHQFIKTLNLTFLYNPDQKLVYEQNKTLP